MKSYNYILISNKSNVASASSVGPRPGDGLASICSTSAGGWQFDVMSEEIAERSAEYKQDKVDVWLLDQHLLRPADDRRRNGLEIEIALSLPGPTLAITVPMWSPNQLY